MGVSPSRRRPLSSLNGSLQATTLMDVSPLHHSPLSFRPRHPSLSPPLQSDSPHPPILPFISLHSPSRAPAIASSAPLYPLIHTAVISIHSLTISLSLPPHISSTNETPLSFLPPSQPLSIPPHFPFRPPSSLPFESLFFTILSPPLSSSNSTISHPPLSSQLLHLYIHIHFHIRTDPCSSAYTIIYFREHCPPFHNLHLSAYLPRTPFLVASYTAHQPYKFRPFAPRIAPIISQNSTSFFLHPNSSIFLIQPFPNFQLAFLFVSNTIPPHPSTLLSSSSALFTIVPAADLYSEHIHLFVTPHAPSPSPHSSGHRSQSSNRLLSLFSPSARPYTRGLRIFIHLFPCHVTKPEA